MTHWLEHLAGVVAGGRAALVVQVLAIEGSAPREAGARMVVDAEDFFGTIGGGRLEHGALAHARAILAGDDMPQVMRTALGPELGQCCGGVVWLGYEAFAPADAAWVARLRAAAVDPRPVVRVVTLAGDGCARDFFTADYDLKRFRETWVGVAVKRLLSGEANFQAMCGDATATLVERVNPVSQPLHIFGAGHVGRALVRALAPLPFCVTWIDSRLGAFDGMERLPAQTHTLAMPELFVDEAEKDGFYLVMTHDHGQDEDICNAVLARGDFAYLGLIGSASKRGRFARRLKGRGHGVTQIERLHCPIGSASMTLKDPAAIAASVAGDLLTRIAPVMVAKKRKSVGHVRHG